MLPSDIDGVTLEDGSGGATTLTNNGTLSVGDGDGLTLSDGSAFSQSSTGTFAPTVDASTGAFGITGEQIRLQALSTSLRWGSPAVGSTYNVIRSSFVLARRVLDASRPLHRVVLIHCGDCGGGLSSRL